MALSEYTIIRRGIELTMMLSEDDAKAAGAVPVAKSVTVEDKAKKAANRAAPTATK